MQFEGYRRSSHIPNLTPLIDIVFLLLIFFMLTSHFVQHESLNIELPGAETGEALNETDVLEIIINSDGQINYKQKIYNSEAILSNDFESLIRQDLAIKTDKSVRIKGDKHVDFGKAVQVLDVVRKAGATGVDIITQQK